MAKRLSPSGKGMPKNDPLYNGGLSSEELSNKAGLKTTLTVDALVLQFEDSLGTPVKLTT